MPRTALLLLLPMLTACGPVPRQEAPTEPPAVNLPATVRQLGVEEAAALIQSTPGLAIVDLREDWEVKKEGRIPGSIWADYLNDERFAAATAKLDPARPCLLYCALGGRSQLAAEKLAARNHTHLHILDGGLEAWLRAAKPVERP